MCECNNDSEGDDNCYNCHHLHITLTHTHTRKTAAKHFDSLESKWFKSSRCFVCVFVAQFEVGLELMLRVQQRRRRRRR